MLSTISALVLLTSMQAGIFSAELTEGSAMIYTACSTLVAGFISSYVAGLALLPRAA